MANQTEDYWPSIASLFIVGDPEPANLLRTQADILSKKTKGVVTGEVTNTVLEGTIYYSLYLGAPALGDYQVKILDIAFPVVQTAMEPFPLTAKDAFGGPAMRITEMGQFQEWLKATLGSKSVLAVIGNLHKYGMPIRSK